MSVGYLNNISSNHLVQLFYQFQSDHKTITYQQIVNASIANNVQSNPLRHSHPRSRLLLLSQCLEE